MFFDKNNEIITIDKFVKCYELDYYVGARNKFVTVRTQPYIEEKIEKILYEGLELKDLLLIIGWKTGALSVSRSCNSLVFNQNFDETFIFKNNNGKKNVSHLVKYISENFNELKELAEIDVKELYRRLFNNRLLQNGTTSGMGSVYILTLVYFFTKGRYPIYDKFAHFALLAFENHVSHNNEKTFLPMYKEISSDHFDKSWDYYVNFKNRIDEEFGNYYSKNGRSFDRALWIYGHYYKN